MAITANKKFWTEFIDIYHSLPSLWNTKEENYNNRESRSFAWNKLVEKLREVEPDANQDSVKRKINTFRSNFNREVRKIRQTQKEQPNEVYHPTLWYFDHLSFLLYQEKCNTSNVSIDGHSYDEEMTLMGLTTTKREIMEENETMPAESINQEEIALTDNVHNLHYENVNTNKSTTRLGVKRAKLLGTETKPLMEYNSPVMEVLSTETTPLNKATTTEPPSQTVTEKDSLNNSEDQPKTVELEKITNHKILRSAVNKKSKIRLKSQDPYNRALMRNNMFSDMLTDEAAIYGQSWACGFRKLSPQQKLFAKKAIDEILILGQLKALKFQTVTMNAHLMEERASDEC